MKPSDTAQPFWKRKSLVEMTEAEWESLCDGCGQCCLFTLQDEQSGELGITALACRYLDLESCRCTEYARRKVLVRECLSVPRVAMERLRQLPESCAYRRLARNEALPQWHPLISGEVESVHRAGISVRGRALSEDNVHPDEWQEHVIEWVR